MKDLNANEILKLAVFAGEIMLQNGAETYRVEDTIQRIISANQYEHSESFVTTTGIFASIGDERDGIITMVKRVKTRTTHLEKIALVNDLSRRLVSGEISAEQAYAQLKEINSLPPYKAAIRVLSSGTVCFCFCFMFGGSVMDSINAFITGVLLYCFVLLLNKHDVSAFLVNLLGGALLSFCALTLFYLGLGDNFDKIITGSIMPLVPGVGLTNAIRDVLAGDFTSGTSRIVDAAIVAISIATGVGAVLSLYLYLIS